MRLFLWKSWSMLLMWLKLVFWKDPIQEWLNDYAKKLNESYEQYYYERMRSLELQIEKLELRLDDKNTDYILLQEQFINTLKDLNLPAPQVDVEIPTTRSLARPSSFAYRKSKLEERARSKNNQTIHERIALAEEEAGINIPDETVEMVPASDTHGI